MYDPSTKPYLIRAIYEWCVDQGYTPYLAVQVDGQTRVPMEHVKDGQIVLNISYTATHQLKIDNDFVHFSARFSGKSRELEIPISAVSGIFAKESGQGMFFQVSGSEAETESGERAGPMMETETSTPNGEEPGGPPSGGSSGAPSGKPPRGGHLKIVK
jgi:stringent starvation protein B